MPKAIFRPIDLLHKSEDFGQISFVPLQFTS